MGRGILYRIFITWGMISPKITIPIVDPITATTPEERASMKMVKVEFTKTLPSNKLEI